ncbi:MAG: hypothetical protein HQL31_12090, partial [Planctomycetes bacterium]|nr:hypothetical protein [Planctomycetota bacterium]
MTTTYENCKTSSYKEQNEVKTSFDEVYGAKTPHNYVSTMARHGYQIGEQARPYCMAAAELLREKNGDVWPVQMLDIGCSYGIGSAFIKFGCSFDELVAFFASRAPWNYASCCEVMRHWLNITSPVCDMRCVGLDCSEPAIQFALDAGLLDGGVARNYEQADTEPDQMEKNWFRSCNLLVSTGAIGYVSPLTMDKVLRHLGHDHPSEEGPFAVFTVLRMFDATPSLKSFEKVGLKVGLIDGLLLPQRRFTDSEEQEGVIEALKGKGLDTAGLED